MSEFSSILEKFIKERAIDLPQLAQYINYDLTVVYKIIKGQIKPPSPAVLRQITVFLRLTQQEQKELTDAWQYTVFGSQKYYRHKSVEHFLLSFPEDYSILWDYTVHEKPSPSGKDLISEAASCFALDTQISINTLLLQILVKETSKKTSSISILAQPDYDFLFQALGSLSPDHTVLIEHIFSLDNTELLTQDHRLLQISYLETILPLFVTSNVDYKPVYHNKELLSQDTGFELLPNMILTSECLLICSSDFQHGIFFKDVSIVSLYRERYSFLKQQCTPLFKAISVDLTHLDEFWSVINLIQQGQPTYIIQEEGCLLPMLQQEIIQELLNPSLPDKELLIAGYASWTQNTRNTQLADSAAWMHQYITKNGLMYFIRNGQFRELPPLFCKPVSRESRIYLLKELEERCQKGMYKMLGTPLEHLSGNLRLVVSGSIGYLVLCQENYPLTYLIFDEPYLLEIFRDYMESLDEYCYSQEDTVERIREMIDLL